MISAIVLAAGTSSRMGRPKQLLTYRGRPLLRHVIDIVSRSSVDQIIVVLGHRREEAAKTLEGLPLQIVVNHNYTSGQSSSVKTGLESLASPHSSPKASKARAGVLFVLGDQPLLKPETINLLIEKFLLLGGIVAPYYQGKRGNPVLFDLCLRDEFDSLEGDAGAREIIFRHPEILHQVNVTDPGILLDVDTPEDLEALQHER
ncbi:MAG: nucleotidyltransferase family protein [Thermincola sp.]|jgi:molybdenum cofactor cytidylyltransferase|nr:nucleotidyltransferase family protein [Thermincola sp.]MDT3701831.1 nucleotidyltransferase family protein [Thermincola sp.]